MDADQQPTLSERMAELRERLELAIRELDVRAEIEKHPWQLVGAAALFGAWLGMMRELPEEQRRALPLRARLGDMLLTGLAALAFRYARDTALRRVSDVAKRWWAETGKPRPRDTDVQYDATH